MAKLAWYPMARRVIAPIAVVLAIGLLVRETCAAKAREPVGFSLRFGDDAPRIRHVRVDLWADDASVGFAERTYGAGGAVERFHWSQPVPKDDLEATISLTMVDGEVVALRRRISALPGSEVVIDATRPR